MGAIPSTPTTILENKMKVNTILFFRNAHEDTSWACIPFHSSDGFDSVQEMVEAISKSIKKVVNDRYENNKLWNGVSPDVCTHSGGSPKTPKTTKDDVEKIVEEMFNGTAQNLSLAWDYLQEEGIESFGVEGDAGQTVSIFYGPELIATTIFDGFPTEDKLELIKDRRSSTGRASGFHPECSGFEFLYPHHS